MNSFLCYFYRGRDSDGIGEEKEERTERRERGERE